MSDAPAAARLHAQEINQGFLASLGEDFLVLLYRRVVLSPGSFLLVAEADDGGVAGFVAGTERTGKLYADFLRRDGLRAAIGARGPLVRAVGRAWETLRYSRTGGGAPPDLPSAELLSLAVAPGHRGRGVGGALVAGFVKEMEARGGAAARVIVASSNATAVRVYEAGGFVPAGRVEVHRGQPSDVLVWRR